MKWKDDHELRVGSDLEDGDIKSVRRRYSIIRLKVQWPSGSLLESDTFCNTSQYQYSYDKQSWNAEIFVVKASQSL
jgi:hypothetical protein